MKSIIKLIIVSIAILLTNGQSNAQSDWYLQQSGTSANLHSVYFINERIGWAVGDSTVLMTTNGGMNWIQQITASTYILYDVFFYDAEVGWVAGENLDPTSWPGVLMMTTNSGEDWSVQLHPYMSFKTVHFIDKYNGFAVRNWENQGIISKTENGGLTWSNIYVNMFYIYKSIFFVNKDTGLVAGRHTYPPSELGGCAITINGGINWTSILGWPGTEFNSVYFVDDYNGWVVGTHGIIVRTTDSGSDWNRQLCPAIYDLNDVYFLNNELGWIVGEEGVILKTINGGEGWLVAHVGVTRNLNSVFFISSTDPSPGWIVGDNGLILSNTHGQVLDVEQAENVFINEFSLSQNYPNPFNPKTVIGYQLPVNGDVTLKVYDVLGNEVATLVNEEKQASVYEVEFDGANLPYGKAGLSSGIYFYQLKAGDYIQTKKMILLK